MRRAVLCGVCLVGALALVGCERDTLRSVDSPPPRGFVLDSGVVGTPLDAGRQTTPEDAGTTAPPDAGPPSDAGPAPDAGDPVGCACPRVPAVCTPPKLDTPIFTTDETAQDELVAMLSCAETSVRAALYEVEWSCVSRALFDTLTRQPQLTVQLVIDDDQCPRDSQGKLTCALRDLEADTRVTIVDDARSRYMHHKFWVVDDRWAWTGSANMTETSFCTEVNDSIVVADPDLVAAYQARFTRLFDEQDFGPAERTGPVTAGAYTLHFGPQTPLSQAPSWHQALLDAIAGAHTSVRFAVFALTREDVAAALVAAHARGVSVQGVLHHRYATNGAALMMHEAGVPLRKASVHTKLLVVDTASVATGSPNWSSNAWMNNEDSLWIDDGGVAAQYEAELDRLWQVAEPL